MQMCLGKPDCGGGDMIVIYFELGLHRKSKKALTNKKAHLEKSANDLEACLTGPVV